MTQTWPPVFADWISEREAFRTGADASGLFPPVSARFADPDEVTSEPAFFDFLGAGVFSPATGGAADWGEIASPAASFDFLALGAFSPAVAGVAGRFEVASETDFFYFLAFKVLSAWVAWLVWASAVDGSIHKPQAQRAQAAIPWNNNVTLFRCIG